MNGFEELKKERADLFEKFADLVGMSSDDIDPHFNDDYIEWDIIKMKSDIEAIEKLPVEKRMLIINIDHNDDYTFKEFRFMEKQLTEG